MKKIYKTLLTVSSMFIFILLSAGTAQASELQMAKNTIQVNGKATIKVKPDIAYINASVTIENKDAKKAQEENAKITDKLKSDIRKKYNLKDEDIITTHYNVRPSYDYVDNKQVFRNYVVDHNLEITLKDIQKAGEMIDSLVESGATNIYNVRFGIQDETQAYNTALQKAVENAKQKADALTHSLGVKKATPISIAEQSESQGFVREESVMMDKLDGAQMAPATTINQSDIQVTARIVLGLQW